MKNLDDNDVKHMMVKGLLKRDHRIETLEEENERFRLALEEISDIQYWTVSNCSRARQLALSPKVVKRSKKH